MMYRQAFVLLVAVWAVAGQRPSFAGSKPIGFPDVSTPADPLGNRFGEDLPLPIEAKGDRALVERVSKLPRDQQPFWYINWKPIEDSRKNPQTYPQRQNSFIDPISGTNSAQNAQANSGGLTSKFGTTNGANANTFNNNRQNEQGYRQNRRRSY